MMRKVSLPYELLLAVFEELFSRQNEDQSLPWSVKSNIRLIHFRTVGVVCKAWLDPARAIFWTEVSLSPFSLSAFIEALRSPTGKPSRIRRVHLFAFPSGKAYNMMPAAPATASIIDHVFIAMRSLPTKLDTFTISCPEFDDYGDPDELGHILYDAVWRAVYQYPHRINVRQFAIIPRPDGRDITPFLQHFHNIRHLHLSITHNDNGFTFTSILLDIQLQSLVIFVDFHNQQTGEDESQLGYHIEAAERLRESIEPACFELQSLGLYYTVDLNKTRAYTLVCFRVFMTLATPL